MLAQHVHIHLSLGVEVAELKSTLLGHLRGIPNQERLTNRRQTYTWLDTRWRMRSANPKRFKPALAKIIASY